MAVVFIYILFTISFFGNFFVRNNFIPAQVTLFTEAIVYLLFLYSLIFGKRRSSGFHLHLCYTFLFMVVIAFSSVVINHYFTPRVIFSMRLFWRFFLFYIAIINIGFDEADFKKINIFISVLLILQLPIVAVQFYMHGGIVEKNYGSFSEGGAVTTMYPVTALMYLAGYYGFFKASLIYPLLGAGFIAWSIVGMKRAVLFLFPLTFVGMYWLIYMKGKSLRLTKHISYLSLIIAITLSVSFTILKFNRTLNPDKIVGGKIDLKYAFEYSKQYTKSANIYDPSVTTGRFSTFVNTFATLKDSGFATLFFGYGPGAFTKSMFVVTVDRRVAKFDEGYGMTPLTYLALEYGILGVITYALIILTFLRMCWKYFSHETDPYWKAFATGSLGLAFFMIFLFCAYNYNSIAGDSFPVLYFYIMGVIFVRLKNAGPSHNSAKRDRLDLQENSVGNSTRCLTDY